MQNKKKLLFQVLFLLIVFAGTIYGIFHGEDLGQIVKILGEVQVIYLLPAVGCVLFFIWGESIIIFYMMHTLDIRLKKWTCFLFSSIGFFFSCITPSASGGQPAQIYYMKRKKIPIPVSTLVLMVVTITYKAVLVFTGLGILVFGGSFIRTWLTGILPVFYLGIALNVFCVTAMMILVFHTTLAKNILKHGLLLLERMHFLKHKDTRHEKLERAMTEYQITAVYFKEHIHVIIYVLIITFAQRFALFLSTYFVYRAFGLKDFSVLTIVLLQAVISVSVDMLPLPGGMGISEKLFLIIFVPVFGPALLLPGMILSRGLSYYTELLLSALLTVLAHFTIREEKTLEESEIEEQ